MAAGQGLAVARRFALSAAAAFVAAAAVSSTDEYVRLVWLLYLAQTKYIFLLHGRQAPSTTTRVKGVFCWRRPARGGMSPTEMTVAALTPGADVQVGIPLRHGKNSSGATFVPCLILAPPVVAVGGMK